MNAINRGLRGIGRERVRPQTCYGINEGPRMHDAELAGMADTPGHRPALALIRGP